MVQPILYHYHHELHYEATTRSSSAQKFDTTLTWNCTTWDIWHSFAAASKTSYLQDICRYFDTWYTKDALVDQYYDDEVVQTSDMTE